MKKKKEQEARTPSLNFKATLYGRSRREFLKNVRVSNQVLVHR
jgi:hypothetical protein